MLCKLYIDEQPFQFKVEGDFFWGKDEVLFLKNDPVLDDVKWRNIGYKVVSAFTKSEFKLLRNSVEENICKAIQETGGVLDIESFELDEYHNYVTSNEHHLKVINITRNLTVKDLNFNINLLVERFEKILGCKLTSWIDALQKSHVQIRISRPNFKNIK